MTLGLMSIAVPRQSFAAIIIAQAPSDCRHPFGLVLHAPILLDLGIESSSAAKGFDGHQMFLRGHPSTSIRLMTTPSQRIIDSAQNRLAIRRGIGLRGVAVPFAGGEFF